MEKIYIIANWKSHKTYQEAKMWFEQVALLKDQYEQKENQLVILCPPFTLLRDVAHLISEYELPWFLGAQDVSPFGEGKYTGAINAEQIKECATYVLIGHSERREHFGETDEILTQKVEQALAVGLTPIYLVQGKETSIPQGVSIAAYEPVFAIGNGSPDNPEDVEMVADAIKEKHSIDSVLYGGSADGKNISSFISIPSIDGTIVGTASLEPKTFADLLAHA